MAQYHVNQLAHFSQARGNKMLVLRAIAQRIGYNDEPMFAGLRRLADDAGVSVNTVRNAINWLLKNDEIELVKTVNQRRYYALKLPISAIGQPDQYDDEPYQSDTATVSTDTDFDTVTVSELTQTVSELTQTVSKLVETVSVLIQLHERTVLNDTVEPETDTVTVSTVSKTVSVFPETVSKPYQTDTEDRRYKFNTNPPLSPQGEKTKTDTEPIPELRTGEPMERLIRTFGNLAEVDIPADWMTPTFEKKWLKPLKVFREKLGGVEVVEAEMKSAILELWADGMTVATPSSISKKMTQRANRDRAVAVVGNRANGKQTVVHASQIYTTGEGGNF